MTEVKEAVEDKIMSFPYAQFSLNLFQHRVVEFTSFDQTNKTVVKTVVSY